MTTESYKWKDNDTVMQIRLPKILKDDFTASVAEHANKDNSWRSVKPTEILRQLMMDYIEKNSISKGKKK